MRVLSFDVGTKNLAYCDVNVDKTFTINSWAVLNCVPSELNVNETSLADLVPYFVKMIQDNVCLWNTAEYDYILIENQPMGGRGSARNLKTKVLSHILQGLLMPYTKNPIQFVHPGLKLKDMPRPEGKSSYRENKQYAIKKTLELLECDECLSKESVKIISQKKTKKDDLADAFLQGYYFAVLVSSGSMEIKKVDVVKKSRPKSKKMIDKSEKVSDAKPETKLEAKPETKFDGKPEAKLDAEPVHVTDNLDSKIDLEPKEAKLSGKKRGRATNK
jgi:hypothetical protein